MFSKHQHEEDGHSLTSVLDTPELRSELTLLVANCTATMRQAIEDTFSAEEASGSQDLLSSRLSGDEAMRNPNLEPGKVDVEALDKERERQRKEKEEREKELSEPKTQELKKAALSYFDGWRDTVLLRIGEVVNSKQEAKSQVQEATAEPQPQQKAIEKKISDHPKQTEGAQQALKELCPPTDTPLVKLEEEKRVLVLHSMLLLLLSLEHYSAHSRVLLLHLTSSLNVSIDLLSENEAQVARGLLEAATKQMNADEETKKKAEENSTARKWKVGLASVAGAAVIGLTGGLAAPLLAAGIGSVMGGLGLGATAAAGYLGTLAGSSVLVGGLFGAYGAKMTGKMMDEYAKEVSDFAFIPVRNYNRPRKIEKEFHRLRVAIGIGGWVTDKVEVVRAWRIISSSIEGFALRWELEALMNLGNSISTIVESAVWSLAKTEIIKRTVFASLYAGLWPLGLLKVSRVVDNPFSVAKSRSEKAGAVLADALINKVQGERPVTLIGYSMGARVIYCCLQSLAERKAFGLVESVVLLGAPTPSDAASWRRIRSVVSGRVVNVYSTKDYILAFLYRTSSIQYGVAGLQPIKDVRGVQNVDVSEIVDGHTRYRYLTGSILQRVGFEDLDLEEVAREEEEMKEIEELEAQQREKNEKQGKKTAAGEGDEKEAEEMEKEVKKKNEQGMMGWVGSTLGGVGDKIGSVWNRERSRSRKRGEGKEKEKTAA